MDIASVVGLIGAIALIVMAMGDPGPSSMYRRF